MIARLWLVSVLFCWALPSIGAELSARVDRSQLGLNDTLELTLESSGAVQFGKPDLKALADNFDILATRQINQTNNLTPGASAQSQWLISLKPKRPGRLSIAPVRLGQLRSPTLYVEVSQTAQTRARAPVFIEASLDRPEVYVQAQSLLTIRVFHSLPLYDDSQLSTLELNDARIERLGEPRHYEQTIEQVLHGVIEVRYAIFAQKSGLLEIPGPTFSATPVEQSEGINRPGPIQHVSAANLYLQVKPKPSAYPADQPWLPAQYLQVEERLTPSDANLNVGDSVTREVVVMADGLPAATLPALTPTLPSSIKHYPDQPHFTDSVQSTGLNGVRRDSQVWVATGSGQVQIPALELFWWNTQRDQLERLELPTRTLEIAANAPTVATEIEPANTPEAVQSSQLWLWQLATAALVISNLLSLVFWWLARRQPAVARALHPGPSTRSLLDDVRRACHQQDPAATRQALDAWARQHPETLAQMAARFAPLGLALDELNSSLYAQTAHQWDGQALWQAVRSLPPLEPTSDATQDAATLPPLYPR